MGSSMLPFLPGQPGFCRPHSSHHLPHPHSCFCKPGLNKAPGKKEKGTSAGMEKYVARSLTHSKKPVTSEHNICHCKFCIFFIYYFLRFPKSSGKMLPRATPKRGWGCRSLGLLSSIRPRETQLGGGQERRRKVSWKTKIY